MKRSEMISLMAKTLENNFDFDNGCWETDAEKLLTVMEEKGMLPPNITAEELRGKDWRWGGGCSMRCNCDQCNPNFKVPAWSKE